MPIITLQQYPPSLTDSTGLLNHVYGKFTRKVFQSGRAFGWLRILVLGAKRPLQITLPIHSSVRLSVITASWRSNERSTKRFFFSIIILSQNLISGGLKIEQHKMHLGKSFLINYSPTWAEYLILHTHTNK